ncbi:hypothetical protein F5878DRAFT_647630 [Lentinula raphanica]|uniref:DUF4100 domain-containing protein n=1 Tax=Lentinula raphanica TaxID=153919 RepID=A0AA38NVK8_9AGAR|nr:hypothetical protein F5878DRAFT_647630 [Lentinula raphanica]
MRDLEDSCILWSNEEPIMKRSDVDKYQRKFFSIAAPLLKQKMLTNELKGYYFLQGLPKKDQKTVEKKLPAENKKKTNPPTIDAIIKLLHEKIDNKDSILHHNWDSDEEDLEEVRQRLQSRLKRREEDDEEEAKVRKSLGEKAKGKKVRIAEEDTNADWKVPHVDGSVPAKCPEMPNLVRENLVVYDYIARKYTLPNGQDLPRIPFGVSGGVAGMLRGNSSSNPTNGVERTGPVLSASPASFSYGNTDVFGNDVFGVASLDQQRMDEVMEGQVYPSLRSGRETARFNPSSQQGRENKKRVDRDPNNFDKPGYRPPVVRGVPPEPTITTEKPGRKEDSERMAKIEVPVPPNPINRQEGWKKSQPSTSKGKEKSERDIEMSESKVPAGTRTTKRSMITRVFEGDDAVGLPSVVDISNHRKIVRGPAGQCGVSGF